MNRRLSTPCEEWSPGTFQSVTELTEGKRGFRVFVQRCWSTKLRKPLANISFPQSRHIHFFNLCRPKFLSTVNFSRLSHGIVSSVCLLWNLVLRCQRYKKPVFSWRRGRRWSGASWGGAHAFAFSTHFSRFLTPGKSVDSRSNLV